MPVLKLPYIWMVQSGSPTVATSGGSTSLLAGSEDSNTEPTWAVRYGPRDQPCLLHYLDTSVQLALVRFLQAFLADVSIVLFTPGGES